MANDIDIDIEDSDISKILERLDSFDEKLKSMADKVNGVDDTLQKSISDIPEEVMYPYPTKYPYSKKSEDGIPISDWIGSVNEIMDELDTRINDRFTAIDGEISSIETSIKSIEEKPEFDTENKSEDVAKFRDKNIVIDRGSIYRI